MIKYAHTNIITDDWKKLSDFYIAVFGCRPIPPKRDLRGAWLDKATGIKDAHLQGIHLVYRATKKTCLPWKSFNMT